MYTLSFLAHWVNFNASPRLVSACQRFTKNTIVTTPPAMLKLKMMTTYSNVLLVAIFDTSSSNNLLLVSANILIQPSKQSCVKATRFILLADSYILLLAEGPSAWPLWLAHWEFLLFYDRYQIWLRKSLPLHPKIIN